MDRSRPDLVARERLVHLGNIRDRRQQQQREVGASVRQNADRHSDRRCDLLALLSAATNPPKSYSPSLLRNAIPIPRLRVHPPGAQSVDS